MRISQNPIVKALTLVMVFVPIYFFATDNDTEEKQENTNPSAKVQSGKPIETANEEIAALSGYLTTVEAEQSAIKSKLDNVVSKDEFEKLITTVKNNSPEGFDESALLEKVNKIISDKTKALQDAIVKQSSVPANKVGNIDDQLDTPFADPFEVNTGDSTNSADVSNDIQWAYPVGYQVEENGVDSVMSSLTPFGNQVDKFSNNVVDGAKDLKENLKDELQPIPYATIHSDSSIHGAKSLTALIGRIERKGKSHEPFRFNLIISGDTLMANGQSMPGVANALVSGIATGDWAFNCVRGKVTSFTFNFEDGRIYNQKGSFEQPLAELGDEWGNPCIKGVLVDDIEKFIAAQGVVSGLAATADIIAKQQQSITSTGNSQSLETTGSYGALAGSSFASGGLNKAGEILSERFNSYYEAIYVPPGAKVSLFFLESINIDYIPTNRKVSYETDSSSLASLD